MQEVSGVYTSLFLDTDELRMALRARKVFGTFEKCCPRLGFSRARSTFLRPRTVAGNRA